MCKLRITYAPMLINLNKAYYNRVNPLHFSCYSSSSGEEEKKLDIWMLTGTKDPKIATKHETNANRRTKPTEKDDALRSEEYQPRAERKLHWSKKYLSSSTRDSVTKPIALSVLFKLWSSYEWICLSFSNNLWQAKKNASSLQDCSY